jgi:hypothetical protein
MKLLVLNILTIRLEQNFELSFSLLIMVFMQIWKAPLLALREGMGSEGGGAYP